ncbi:putative NAD(P)H-dependent D-xylose reductase xyl1 [Hypsizygus marmoreus]|uniref:NAD(P)H-dependent D-xylose reductase xyl1 n=1 Tax=Hypsizygus marmoreus TaxID=39966 RepID=A0A369K2V1_HYPMA|nr:putative NAD(P)H-dependent D-xylose reductase xyl1 [Hypsizygus marmoreus]
MATIVLKRTGQKMPLVGFGLWKVTKASCADTVYEAIRAGCRLFDGAGDYGNEKEAGEGVRRAIQDGLVKREDLFITSKLWNTFHAHDHVKSITKKQLGLWGIEYFDLFLVHFPIALQYVDPAHRYPPEWYDDDGRVRLQNTPMQETWGAMEELVDEGHAKNIGLSNCNGSIILDVLRYARIEPQVLQVELHPYLTQDALVNLAKTLGIALTAYSSFGPQGYIELDMDKNAPSLMSHGTVIAIAQKHKKAPAQVLLRWATQRGVAVVPKSNKVQRIKENLLCDSFDLEESEINSISALNINLRLNDPAEIDPRLAIFA